MAKASISLRSLNETLNRVESRLLSLEARFAELDCSLQSLEHEFERQEELLEQDLRRDVPWAPAARLGGAVKAEKEETEEERKKEEKEGEEEKEEREQEEAEP